MICLVGGCYFSRKWQWGKKIEEIKAVISDEQALAVHMRQGVPHRCIQGNTLYMFEQFGVDGKLYVEGILSWWFYGDVEICVLSKTHRKLLFNNLSIVWNIKILLITFCQESPQMLCAKFGGNGWNCLGEVRKSRFATFREFAMACMTRFSTIQWMRGYMVCECATKYMWVTSQNTPPLIIAPPGGGNWGRQ